ncbi:MAG: toxin-antitoxin system HicB family antitoxin [Caldilineaceae bacterium]|nr:toxin-antitoxin system HicB family antitoxin [Caldilineaceae bacterium]
MGRFTVRLPDTLHHQLESRAQQEGVSLNQYVVYALTQNITPAYTIQVLPDVEIRKQGERFDALLKRLGVPDASVAGDFLSTREEEEVDAETARLVSQVQAKIRAAN